MNRGLVTFRRHPPIQQLKALGKTRRGTIGILGLFAALIPELAVIGICWWKEENYKKQCNVLLTKWIDAGRPDPAA